jgi:hypothetical protein
MQWQTNKEIRYYTSDIVYGQLVPMWFYVVLEHLRLQVARLRLVDSVAIEGALGRNARQRVVEPQYLLMTRPYLSQP